MLNKLKQAVEASMDALAPPPLLHEDFVYQWKRFMRHYLNLSVENKASVEFTNLPGCLDRLRDILINEDQEIIENGGFSEIGPCMEYLLQHCLLDLLINLAIADEPLGIKSCIFRFLSKILTQLREPNIAHSAVYIPLMKLMNVCDGLLHSVYEADEIEFLLHLSAVLRKQSAISVLFFSNESTETLTEMSETGETIQYKNILDLILTYVDSADCEVRVKACQCIILLCSVDDNAIAQCIISNLKFNHFIVGRLTMLFYEIPSMNYDQFKNIEASWTLDIPQKFQIEIIKNRPAIVFFNWVDFIDQLSNECHPFIKEYLSQSITKNFLDEVFNISHFSSPETIAVFSKYYHTITSSALLTGFHKWLIITQNNVNVPEINTNPILQTLIDNSLSKSDFFIITSLEFFVELLNKCDEQILDSLILCYLKDRSYYDATAIVSSWSDEEDERQKYSSSPEASSSFSKTLAPSNIDRVIQSFTSLIPTEVQTKSGNENLQYVQEQYDEIIDRCSQFKWPLEAVFDVERTSNDSNPESDSHVKWFYEGPFLRMIFSKVQNFPQLTYSEMFAVTSIVSKLAMLPHPYLHEYLLNPLLPLKKEVKTLYLSLKKVANEVYSRARLVLNLQEELQMTRQRLLFKNENLPQRSEIDRYLEAFILLEELCNELATIAYVKYLHFRKL